MGAGRLRRLVLIAGVLVVCSPVFSRADTGERRDPESSERPEDELRLEASPSTGYGRFAICDSLSRVRYGGLGASARYRHGAFAAKVGGSVVVVGQHTTDEGDDETVEPPSTHTWAMADGVAQAGVDTHYIAAMGGIGLLGPLRDGKDIGVLPSLALRLGSYRGMSLKLSIADYGPVGMAIGAAELAYQHEDALRVGAGLRLDAYTLNVLPAARVELPVGPHWMGLCGAAGPGEGALSWQLQLLFDFQLFASDAKNEPRQRMAR